jgi:hypothetical protein
MEAFLPVTGKYWGQQPKRLGDQYMLRMNNPYLATSCQSQWFYTPSQFMPAKHFLLVESPASCNLIKHDPNETSWLLFMVGLFL